jgi:hypothetical protein
MALWGILWRFDTQLKEIQTTSYLLPMLFRRTPKRLVYPNHLCNGLLTPISFQAIQTRPLSSHLPALLPHRDSICLFETSPAATALDSSMWAQDMSDI